MSDNVKLWLDCSLNWKKPFIFLHLLRPATLLKKRPGTDVFTCEFCEISKNTFLDRTSLVAASELCALSIYINTPKKIRKEYCLFNYKNPLWKRWRHITYCFWWSTVCLYILCCPSYKLFFNVFIHYKLRVAQKGRFVMRPVFLGGGTIPEERFWILGFLKARKMNSSGPFTLPTYPQKVEFYIVFAKSFLNIHVK